MRLLAPVVAAAALLPASAFSGFYFTGEGDENYLQLLDISYGQWSLDSPALQGVPMFYIPTAGWNAYAEGPTWGAWWTTNSYGGTYAALPFLAEPSLSFVNNSNNFWFENMGNGTRSGPDDPNPAPDGCLCDDGG
jgi:hypothetical protein